MNIKNEAFPGGGHVVILGAGASIASTRLDPEKNGKRLPSMNELPNVIPMHDLLRQIPANLYSDNANIPSFLFFVDSDIICTFAP